MSLNESFAPGGTTDTDEEQADRDWDAFVFAHSDILPLTRKSNLPRSYEPAPGNLLKEPYLLGHPGVIHAVEALRPQLDPENLARTHLQGLLGPPDIYAPPPFAGLQTWQSDEIHSS